MIGRKSTLTLSELYARVFRTYHRARSAAGHSYYTVDTDGLYDFLYAEGFQPWFCNSARAARNTYNARPLQDFIMQLHTGETQAQATLTWSWEQRAKLGQSYLQDLAEDIPNHLPIPSGLPSAGSTDELKLKLIRRLELDGYRYAEGRLIAPEASAVDIGETTTVLQSLYRALKLGNEETAFHHLSLSEEHYVAHRWDDSIGNSRKFLECVVSEGANVYSIRSTGSPLPEASLSSPAAIREFLTQKGLLETREKEAISQIYGLLSHTGSHPYMASNDQARLLRHLALTTSEFALLRLNGALGQAA